MVKQVYQVKRDGRKSAVSDLTPNNKKPAESMLATKGKEVKRVTFKDPIVDSEQAKLKVPNIKKNMPLREPKPQPRCLLGLSHWQDRKLQRLRADELKKRNMAWIPKENHRVKEDVQAPVVKRAAGVKKENHETNKRPGRRFPSHHRRLRPACHPYYPTSQLMPMPWNSSPGMIGYPPWDYFDPWMQHNSLHHERVLPNHYSFD
jgi:hypothetical protein